jgi:hypothetical protein
MHTDVGEKIKGFQIIEFCTIISPDVHIKMWAFLFLNFLEGAMSITAGK